MDFKIIAVDFDGTLCENKWPEIGAANKELINYIKEQKNAGAKIILWTCRTGILLDDAVRWCDEYYQLQFDMVNRNVNEAVKEFGDDTRKVFAHEYIDDRMCNRFKLPFVEELSNNMTPKEIPKELRIIQEKYKDAADAIDFLQAFVDHIGELPTCNSCARTDCECRPLWGETVRYNCHLYLKESSHIKTVVYETMGIQTEKLLNPYGEYVMKFAKNHSMSLDEAYQHPMCKTRLNYFNMTGA